MHLIGESASMHGSLRDELEAKSEALVALCRKHGVAALDLFGSGARDDWRPEESDLDFIIEFHREQSETRTFDE